jgi:hypothetical protein
LTPSPSFVLGCETRFIGTALKKPQILNKLVKSIDELDWYSAKSEGLGDLYEGLLEKTPVRKNLVQGNTLRRVS